MAVEYDKNDLQTQFEGIRDERRLKANTAYRIGTAFLSLLHFASDEMHTTIEELLKKIEGKYLSKVKNDEAAGLITFLRGLRVGAGYEFNENGDISSHDIDANAVNANDLNVGGNSVFAGDLSSPDFVAGFLTGKGWRLKNEPVENAAGVLENKYNLELDNLIVRGTMRIFEMVISQLLSDLDHRTFTAMMEVDHYDAESGRVYLDTREGRMYNSFRKGDYIMVQQYNGLPSEENDYYVTKRYELLVKEIGTEGEGEDRLAWVTFENFTTSMAGATPEELIKKRDTFVRVDNVSDPDRKGVIQVMTVGSDTPYIDIAYGLKTNPDSALKGRLGNLKGIRHPILGKLQGFGEYLNNLYAVGDLILRRTGESVDTKFQVLENMLSTRFAKTSYELTNGQNYLENGQFLEQVTDADNTIIDSWEIDADEETMLWVDATGMPFMVNSTLTTSGNKKVTLEQIDGRQMLRIQNCGLRQKNAIIKQPGTHKEYVKGSGYKNDAGLSQTETSTVDVQDKLYVNVRIYAKTAGQLTYGFEGCKAVDGKENTLTAKTENIAYSGEWQTVRVEGKWNGTGDFIIRYSGDCYIALVTITDEPLSEFSKTVSTQIIQTAENIKLLGENIDKVNGTTTQLGYELDAEKGEIRQYVNEVDKNNREYTSSQITQTAKSITSTVEANKKDADGNFESVRTDIKQNADSIESTVKQVNKQGTRISDIEQDVNTIRSTVGQAATQAQLTANVNTLNKNISDNLDAAKSYANSVGSGIRNDYASAITTVQQKKDSWSVASGMFDANGNLTRAGITSITPSVTTIANTRFDANWGAIKSGYVATADFSALQSTVGSHTAQIGTRITKDEANNLIAEATIQADKINLTGHCMNFTGGTLTITTDNFTLDAKGNMWCQNGTFSGKVSGVHGSFKTLDCVDSNGKVVGSIQFGSDGRMWFSGDMYHQGYDSDKKRGYRFYASDLLCRGMFGHRQKVVGYVFGAYMIIYNKDSDDFDNYVRIPLESGTESGKKYYKIPLYGFANYEDASGFAIDVVVINCSSDFYYVFGGMGNGKEWRVINGDNNHSIHFADIGGWHELKGGASLSCVYVNPRLLTPIPTNLGAGVLWSGEMDLNWS